MTNSIYRIRKMSDYTIETSTPKTLDELAKIINQERDDGGNRAWLDETNYVALAGSVSPTLSYRKNR